MILLVLPPKTEGAPTSGVTVVDGDSNATVEQVTIGWWLQPCGTSILLTGPRPTYSRSELRRQLRGVMQMASRMTEIAEVLVTSYVSV